MSSSISYEAKSFENIIASAGQTFDALYDDFTYNDNGYYFTDDVYDEVPDTYFLAEKGNITGTDKNVKFTTDAYIYTYDSESPRKLYVFLETDYKYHLARRYT